MQATNKSFKIYFKNNWTDRPFHWISVSISYPSRKFVQYNVARVHWIGKITPPLNSIPGRKAAYLSNRQLRPSGYFKPRRWDQNTRTMALRNFLVQSGRRFVTWRETQADDSPSLLKTDGLQGSPHDDGISILGMRQNVLPSRCKAEDDYAVCSLCHYKAITHQQPLLLLPTKPQTP